MVNFENMKQMEEAIQKKWKAEGVDKTHETSEQKSYVLGMFPYPSGNAHMGHALVYSISDTLARLERFTGKDVLHPIGWDAFGLPAENAAIKNNVHPEEWTRKNIEKMRDDQIGPMGFSFDLDREIVTASPEYYRWTQWLILKLYENNLLYRADEWVNWDPVDQTVLANEQVIDGKGWRSGAPIQRKKMEQWFVRITDYAEDLWNGLDELNWSSQAKGMQRNWIGRMEGVDLHFSDTENKINLTTFIQNPEYMCGIAAIYVAPEHDLADSLTVQSQKDAMQKYINSAVLRNSTERVSQESLSPMFTGSYVMHPITKRQIPVFVSDHILPSDGTGIAVAIPAVNEKDAVFAQSRHLEYPEKLIDKDGKMINSWLISGKSQEAARKLITDYIEQKNIGERKVRYKLKDWSISRQRFWGCPIPFVKDNAGNFKPVSEQELPVLLPKEMNFELAKGRSPLTVDKSFLQYENPQTGEKGTRETDTLDTFMCSAWYVWRFLDPHNSQKPWDPQKAKKWMPIDYYIGGLEHANQHMIYFRFMSHFLYKLGLTPVKEPVKNFLDNGIIKLGGHKMSKSLGNVVRPDEMIEKYGADALRLYLLSDKPFQLDTEWNEEGLQAKRRFLVSLANMYKSVRSHKDEPLVAENLNKKDKILLGQLNTTAKEVRNEIENNQSFHVAIAKIYKFANLLTKNKDQINENSESGKAQRYAMKEFLKVIGIFTPHISDTLWRECFRQEKSIFTEKWPNLDTTLVESKTDEIAIPLTVNGKKKYELSIDASASNEEIEKAISESQDKKVQSYRESLGENVKVLIIRDKKTLLPRLINLCQKTR